MDMNSMIMVDPSSFCGPTHCDHNFRVVAGLGHDEHYHSSIEKDGQKSHKSKNDLFQFFADAGRRGGLISKKHAEFRLSLICRLVRDILQIQPFNKRLPATIVADKIHDLFAAEIKRLPDIYGHERSVGSYELSVDKPYLDYLVRQIRKLANNGRPLVKFAAKLWNLAPEFELWNPTPEFVSA